MGSSLKQLFKNICSRTYVRVPHSNLVSLLEMELMLIVRNKEISLLLFLKGIFLLIIRIQKLQEPL